LSPGLQVNAITGMKPRAGAPKCFGRRAEACPKMRNHLLIILAAGVVALVGCGKSDKGGAHSIPAKMDFAKF
jgi:hypothetical protein